MNDSNLDVVTGAFSNSGKHITGRLLEAGREVRTLTGHPRRPHPFGDRVRAFPLAFDDERALARSLEGASTLYCTYWIRNPYRGMRFDRAVRNLSVLFRAAREAGVTRVVHVSVTNPSLDSPLAYFRGKAQAERALIGSGLSYGIVRPALVFGEGDVLVNNIAWLLRRMPLFLIPGSGAYRVRPVFVGDLADLCLRVAGQPENVIVDAVGPETMTFEEMVGLIREAVGSRTRLLRAPGWAIWPLTLLIDLVVRDVVITHDELRAVMAEIGMTYGPATGTTAFSGWLRTHADEVGRRYANDLDRHYRGERAIASR